jgi:hypothetical protein
MSQQKSLSICDYGAVSDGSVDNTIAFTNAIKQCCKNNGGLIDISAGTYLTGPIRLKSNVTLHLEEGARMVVNGAFESCGYSHSIGKEYLSCREHNDPKGDTIKTIIRDVGHVLRVAHEKGILFSEVGAAWAKKSGIFDLRGYKKFPTPAHFEPV